MLLIEIPSDFTTVEPTDYTTNNEPIDFRTTENGGICEDVICENGGSCFPEEVPDTSSEISFRCLCPINWTGQYCENGKMTIITGMYMYICFIQGFFFGFNPLTAGVAYSRVFMFY